VLGVPPFRVSGRCLRRSRIDLFHLCRFGMWGTPILATIGIQPTGIADLCRSPSSWVTISFTALALQLVRFSGGAVACKSLTGRPPSCAASGIGRIRIGLIPGTWDVGTPELVPEPKTPKWIDPRSRNEPSSLSSGPAPAGAPSSRAKRSSRVHHQRVSRLEPLDHPGEVGPIAARADGQNS
jgi:hypothetical protein